MAIPKNQTQLHAELAAMSIRWFAARSTGRGIVAASEVTIAPQYVCDALAIGGFQHRFLVKYLRHSGLVAKHYVGDLDIGRKIVGDVYNDFVCLFEAKASRGDFRSTFIADNGKHQNRHSPIASLHWVVVPKGLIDITDVPEFWGILEASGSGLRETKMPYINVLPESEVHRFGYEILMRNKNENRNWLKVPTCPNCLKKYGKAPAALERNE
jgi:hypothetical protein